MTALPANLARCDAELGCCAAPPRAMPWLRLVIGLFVAAQAMSIGTAINLTPPDDATTRYVIQGGMLAATIIVIALLGGPLIADAIAAMRRRKVSMELLFIAGISGAMGISLQSMIVGRGPVYFDTVSVLLTVYAIGRAISQASRQRALDAIESMRTIATTARRVSEYGEEDIAVSSIRAGDCVRVNPGELIPVDGVIKAGESFVRNTPLTGELVSRPMGPGDTVTSGGGVEDGSLLVSATADGNQRKLDRLVDLVERAAAEEPQLQRQADKFVPIFLPIVLAIAVASFGYWAWRVSIERGLYTGLAVLLVACPCAAGLATPLTLWVTLSRLAKRGVIATSGDAIERLAGVKTAVFDKTGTLADETLELTKIEFAEGVDERRVLAMIAVVERNSSHPVAHLLSNIERLTRTTGLRPVPSATDETSAEFEDHPQGPEARGTRQGFRVLAVRTLPAKGIEAKVLHEDRMHLVRLERDRQSQKINVTIDDLPAASIEIAETLRASAAQCVADLRQRGLAVHVMTGDASAGVASPLSAARAQMTPADKLAALRELDHPLYVGDGVNDAPAIAAAHASIALASGSTLAVSTASATLHGGNLSAIPAAIDLARSAVARIRSNLRWAIGYNLVGVALAVAGWLHPVLAAVLMGLSSAVVSWRAFRDSETSPCAKGLRLRQAFSVGRVLWIAWMLQGLILIPLLNFNPLQAVVLLTGFAIIARLARPWYFIAPAWLDMTLTMVAVGGVGMNFGWWMDLGFIPARDACCASGPMSSPMMYFGMILLGTPAMYLLRRTSEPFSFRKWCCVGPLVLGVPGMVGGMWVGSMSAKALAIGWSPTASVLLDYALMTAGMAVGMLLPHVFERQQ